MAGRFVFRKLASHLSSKSTRSLFPSAAEASRNFNTFPSAHSELKISCPTTGLPSVDHTNHLIKPWGCARDTNTTTLFSTTVKDRPTTIPDTREDVADFRLLLNIITAGYFVGLFTWCTVSSFLVSRWPCQSSECPASSSNDQSAGSNLEEQ